MINYSLRGATCIKKNDEKQIEFATQELLLEMMTRNNINKDDITQIIFSATRDITKIYPAACARKLGITNASLMCLQEMYVENSLPLCIRVLMNFNGNENMKISNVYLHEAKKLRPDLQD